MSTSGTVGATLDEHRQLVVLLQVQFRRYGIQYSIIAAAATFHHEIIVPFHHRVLVFGRQRLWRQPEPTLHGQKGGPRSHQD